MSNEKNSFGRLMDLFKGLPRLITTESVVINPGIREGDQLVAPVNGLVLIDAKCGSRSIIQTPTSIKYIVVSKNTVLFNGVHYRIAFLVEENIETGKYKIFNALFSSDTLAVHCDAAEQQFETVGNDPSFIGNPKKHTLTRIHKTNQEGVFIHEKLELDISSKLTYNIDETGLNVTTVSANQS